MSKNDKARKEMLEWVQRRTKEIQAERDKAAAREASKNGPKNEWTLLKKETAKSFYENASKGYYSIYLKSSKTGRVKEVLKDVASGKEDWKHGDSLGEDELQDNGEQSDKELQLQKQFDATGKVDGYQLLDEVKEISKDSLESVINAFKDVNVNKQRNKGFKTYFDKSKTLQEQRELFKDLFRQDSKSKKATKWNWEELNRLNWGSLTNKELLSKLKNKETPTNKEAYGLKQSWITTAKRDRISNKKFDLNDKNQTIRAFLAKFYVNDNIRQAYKDLTKYNAVKWMEKHKIDYKEVFTYIHDSNLKQRDNYFKRLRRDVKSNKITEEKAISLLTKRYGKS